MTSLSDFRCERIGDATLYLGDCLEIMPLLGEFDLCLADPPYGYGYTPNRNGSVNSLSFKRNFGPEHKLIGDTGNMDFDPSGMLGIAENHIFWGGNCFSDKLPNFKSWLVWFKADGNTKIDQGHAELAWTDFGCAIRGLNHRWCGMVKDSERGIKAQHPTQKPVAVMEWCLKLKPKAKKIIDPYMGSGTTGVACAKLGRKFTGIELDPDYFEIACERIRKAYEQADLFVAPPENPIKPKQGDLL